MNEIIQMLRAEIARTEEMAENNNKLYTQYTDGLLDGLHNALAMAETIEQFEFAHQKSVKHNGGRA